MRFFIPLLSLLLCLACTGKKDYSFSGSFTPYGSKQVKDMTLTGADTVINVPVDSNGCFSIKTAPREYPYFLLHAVVHENGKRWPVVTPVYLKEGKDVRLDFELIRRVFQARTDDPDNAVYQQFRERFLGTLAGSLRFNPTPEQIKGRIDSLLMIADGPAEKGEIEPAAAEYLHVWSRIIQTGYIRAAVRTYKERKLEGHPETIYTDLPEYNELLDKPYWMTISGSSLKVINYLREETDSPEAQLEMLEKEFKTPDLLEDQRLKLVDDFVNYIPYSEENLDRLRKIAARIPEANARKAIERYSSRKYAVKGAPVPDVRFHGKDGKEHSLAEFKGRYVYVDLWASWCGPCCQEVPFMQKLEKAMAGNRNIAFVSISLDEKKENWENKMEQLKMHGNQWMIEDSTYPVMMNIHGIPHFLIYDKEGKLMEYSAPRPSDPKARKLLESLK